ncbi:hypothetical protein T440DRAFT_529331 [Plenodomus tracheiphilus IPT5]|uniref:SET domain-containing protein n=1 Tax=Plenodomus tracheiphilus IPT5 TaxID=1408161 RepID=A0A6A7B6W1_9PLEO|nr:hypothetical protein T440DRAFT_529331 [Plenodomus tracheiphilus IPT5]
MKVDFPWIEQRHLSRSPRLVRIASEEMQRHDQTCTCYLDFSAPANNRNVLRIFAASKISPGECILFDWTATAAGSTMETGSCGNCYGLIPDVPTQGRCILKIYCGMSATINIYHRVLCKHAFEGLTMPTNGLRENASPLRPLIVLRFIATFIQAGAKRSPLDHPLIVRLQPLAPRCHLHISSPSPNPLSSGLGPWSNSESAYLITATLIARCHKLYGPASQIIRLVHLMRQEASST